MNAILILSAVVIAVIIWYGTVQSGKRQQEVDQAAKMVRAKELKAEYDEALRSGDKVLALEKGRAYYSFLRDGILSVYDEQAIANDMNAIR